MRKILLIITLILCIFQMIVLATAVDVGSAAIDRGNNDTYNTYTNVDQNNPANDTGTITSVEIYTTNGMTGVEVATFFVVSGNNLSTRDTVTIGNVTGGSTQTFTTDSNGDPIALSVTAGDYIGLYFATGDIVYDGVGTGVWYKSGDYIPCTDTTFTSQATLTYSIYGIGISYNWNTKPIRTWNGTTSNKWNGI